MNLAINEIEKKDLSNAQLVKEINEDVHLRVSGADAQEATSYEDIGVKYVVDYPKLVQDRFEENWNDMEEEIYKLANKRFIELVTEPVN